MDRGVAPWQPRVLFHFSVHNGTPLRAFRAHNAPVNGAVGFRFAALCGTMLIVFWHAVVVPYFQIGGGEALLVA